MKGLHYGATESATLRAIERATLRATESATLREMRFTVAWIALSILNYSS